MLGSSLTIMGAVMIAPALPKMGAEFGPTEPAAQWLIPLVVAGPALAIALFAPLAGWLADRIGRKALLIFATVLYALLGVLPATLNNLSDIVLTRLLFGCAEAAVMTCCATLIADYWQGQERMRFINYQVITIGLVGALFFVIGGVLGERSWRLPFYLYLLPLVLVPIMAKVLWEPERETTQPAQHTLDSHERVAYAPLIIGYLLVFGGMLLNLIVPIQAPALLVSMGTTSTTMIGLCAGLGLLSTLIGSVLWPMLRSRLGLNGCNALLLALLALGLWLLSTAQTYNEVLLAVCIHGTGAGLLVPNAMTPVMNALTANTRGRGLGVFTSCLYLGQFISPLVVAAIVSQGHELRSAVAGLAIVSLAGSAVWLLSCIRRPAAPQHPTPSDTHS